MEESVRWFYKVPGPKETGGVWIVQGSDREWEGTSKIRRRQDDFDIWTLTSFHEVHSELVGSRLSPVEEGGIFWDNHVEPRETNRPPMLCEDNYCLKVL